MSYNVVDPLAQSFLVEDTCVVTKVELFFKNIDRKTPMRIQLRDMKDGFPGDYIIPLSDKFVYPKNISTSADGSKGTIVRFDSPVFLKKGEYALCLGSDSKKYTVFISELDTTDLITGKRIIKQPYLGSLFKSQNTSTWTPEQMQDLKFSIFKAKFDTTAAGSIDFNVNNSLMETQVLEEDPCQTFSGSTTMRVNHFNHGMTDGSYVKLSGIAEVDKVFGTTGTIHGVDFTNVLNTALVIANASLNGYTVTLPTAANADARFGGTRVTATENIVVNALYPITSKIEETTTQVQHLFKGTYSDYSQDLAYTVLEPGTTELSKSRIITNSTTKAENLSGADSFSYRIGLSSQNTRLSPVIDQQQLGVLTAQNLINNPDESTENPLTEDLINFMTSVASVTFTAVTTTSGILTVPLAQQDAALKLIPGTTAYITDSNTTNTGTYRISNIASNGDEILFTKISGTCATNTGTYTISIGRNFVAEEAPSGGSVYSKYITRKIDFANPSTSINLRLDVNRPAGSNIKVFYKSSLVGESDDIAENEFKHIDALIPILPVSLDKKFQEVEVELLDLPPFESIVFKIAFTSTDSASVPKCKNLRIIALA
jgi:hypothetical protein